jgi:2-(1,2-epoxy-1,2-dihydrophenyl)acetyl-CoA isomerase
VTEDPVKNSERVRLTIAGGVATIALDREARMNAFDEAMHASLRAALATAATDASLRAVILTGSGRAFSSGQDLGERAATFAQGQVPDLRASLEGNYNPLVRCLAQLPIPVIAAVNGIAFGAGAALAIACDIVVAARSARFQFGFINVGLGPDSGASWHLPRLVGPARAMDLALTARPVSAEEALAMGLVSRMVEDADLAETAAAIAREFATKSAPAVAAVKRQLRANPAGTLDAALDVERDTQSLLGASVEYRNAVLHFSRPRT